MTPGFVLACLVALVLVPALWRGGRLYEAARLVLSAPAWLVPAAFSLVVMLAWCGGGLDVVENPWVARDVAASLVLGLLMAAGVAGQVGLLRAHGEGRVGDSGDFWRGIRDHTAVLFAGKLLLGGALALLPLVLTRLGALAERRASSVLPGPLGMLYLVPNILLAALVGTAAQRPREILRPLREAFAIGIRDTGKVALIVIAHATWLGVLLELFAPRYGPAVLGPLASSLSHGLTPPLRLSRDFAAVVWLALSGIGSSICITAMVLGVTRGFAANGEDAHADERESEAGSEAAADAKPR